MVFGGCCLRQIDFFLFLATAILLYNITILVITDWNMNYESILWIFHQPATQKQGLKCICAEFNPSKCIPVPPFTASHPRQLASNSLGASFSDIQAVSHMSGVLP